MQSVSSRIWTRVTVSISYDDHHYIMGTSTLKYVYRTDNDKIKATNYLFSTIFRNNQFFNSDNTKNICID